MAELNSSTHTSGSEMSYEEEESIEDFLSILESEYDSGLDTSYSNSLNSSYSSGFDSSYSSGLGTSSSDFSSSSSTGLDAHDARDDYDEYQYESENIDPEPVSGSYHYGTSQTFEPLPPLRDNSTGSFGLSPPSNAKPSVGRFSSISSMLDSLLLKPIASIGSIGPINPSGFDFRDCFPPPLAQLTRQVTPPRPPPIPEYSPFSDYNGKDSPKQNLERIPKEEEEEVAVAEEDSIIQMDFPDQNLEQLPKEEVVNEESIIPMDVDRETSIPSTHVEKYLDCPLPPLPAESSVQITPPTPRRKLAATPHTTTSTSRPRSTSRSSSQPKQNRKRKENNKKRTRRTEPKVKRYVAKTDEDVLMGRGGCSNHHPGNEIYRRRILKLQKTYKTLSREAKTKMSKDVVKWVYNRGGQFLQREGKKDLWYVVTTETARQKVSQALREDHTLEGRMLKKSRTKCYKTNETVKIELITTTTGTTTTTPTEG